MAGAVPAAVNGCRMQAGPASHSRPANLVAGGMVIAEPTFEPGRVFADPHGRMLGEDNTARLFHQPLGNGAVGFDALDV